jgi:long-chain acyl-CoA synthetase
VQAFAHLLRDPARPLLATPCRTVTAGELDALAEAARARVEELRLPPGALVGLAAANGAAFLASFLALRRAGAAALLLDPHTPGPERLRVARALGAAALLTCRAAWPRHGGDWTVAAVPPDAAEPAAREPRLLPGIAVVKLTSGSTGAPRGIATPAEALLADDAALSATMEITRDDRLLTAIPMSHSYGLSSLALPALVRGTLLVLPEGSDPFAPFAAAERAGATVFPTVPAYLQALLAVSQPPPRPRSLRLVVSAGAPLAPATAGRFRETFGLPVHVFYGASECGGICYDREGEAGERGTVGTPVEGVRVTLGRIEAPEEAAEEEGIVRVDSPAAAAGYLPEPEPRLAGGRFTTGDLAAWKDGELQLRGRVDDLINIKGKKVNPREVEAVLARLPGVEEVAALALPTGGSTPVLRAVVACRCGRLSPEDVLAWCRAHLAPHKVPRSLLLVPELPRTARGKLDRQALLAARARTADRLDDDGDCRG